MIFPFGSHHFGQVRTVFLARTNRSGPNPKRSRRVLDLTQYAGSLLRRKHLRGGRKSNHGNLRVGLRSPGGRCTALKHGKTAKQGHLDGSAKTNEDEECAHFFFMLHRSQTREKPMGRWPLSLALIQHSLRAAIRVPTRAAVPPSAERPQRAAPESK